MPTLDTVAQRAGVSRQTVSNALHHPERLRPDTRERVLEVVDELGYRPSAAARQLVTKRSMAVAVPMHAAGPADTVAGLLLDTFLHALAEAGQTTGHRVLLYPSAADDQEVAALENLLLGGAADAVVLTATHRADGRVGWLRQHAAIFSSFGRPWGAPGVDDPAGPQVHDWVDVDGAHGCARAVEHLVALGCRCVGFLGWAPDGAGGDDRRAGWRSAAGRLGALPPGPVIETTENVAAAEAAVTAALARPDAPDGLVCASDTVAFGAWRATRGELPLVGFDATPVTAALGLASVAQPVADAARTCLDLVRDRLGGHDPPGRGVLLAPTLRLP
jgi:DNA-binding LacI/PurR family transcriptional regulator